MKVFIPVESKTGLDSMIDRRLGRAPYFLIYDTQVGQVVSLQENPFKDENQGVGIQVANLILSSGCTIVLGATAGPKAADILKQANVQMITVEGVTVRQALQDFQDSIGKTDQ